MPSALNPADSLSRGVADHSDWRLDRTAFHRASEWLRWWPSIDLFASPINAQCRQFVTRYPHPRAVASDPLRISWDNLPPAWANPPWKLLPHVVDKLASSDLSAIAVAFPLWASLPTRWLLAHADRVTIWQPQRRLFREKGLRVRLAPQWPLCIARIRPQQRPSFKRCCLMLDWDQSSRASIQAFNSLISRLSLSETFSVSCIRRVRL